MRKFSERKGLIPVSDVIQTGDISMTLRNSLWNVLETCLWSTDDYLYAAIHREPGKIPHLLFGLNILRSL